MTIHNHSPELHRSGVKFILSAWIRKPQVKKFKWSQTSSALWHLAEAKADSRWRSTASAQAP